MKVINLVIVLVFLMGASKTWGQNRPDEGVPLTAQELEAATDNLLNLLSKTRYFDFVDSRIHGWPESAPQYSWWGTYWSGVTVKKENGLVNFVHNADGSDNNGLRTAPFLEGACYSYLLTKNPKLERLTQKMLRGMTGWVLSSAVNANDLSPKVLNRAFYPPSVMSMDSQRNIYYNYDASRPGKPNPASNFVHLPENPFYGDIYIKNNRSSDDMGHIIRSLTLVQAACEEVMTNTKEDFNQVKDAYARWGKDVDDAEFRIPTLDENGNYTNTENVSVAYTYNILGTNPFCVGPFAVRLLHSESAGDIDCGSGISWMESLLRNYLKNDAFETLRAHHTAALVIAKKKGLDTSKLMEGFIKRVSNDFTDAQSSNPPKKFNKRDVPMFLIAASNAGVSLTSNEIRWLHEKLHNTNLGLSQSFDSPVFNLFNQSTPDGEYSYDAPEVEDGIYFRGLGMLIGSCASPYRSTGRPLLDCQRLQKYLSSIIQ